MVLDPNAFLKPYRPRMNRLPKPVKPFSYRHRVYAPISRKAEPEEQHYWTVEQWEEWATNEFYNNPDTVLPEWFVKEMQEEEE